jgi:hypothetical protein
LGAVERARELIEAANLRATELGHGPSMAAPLFVKTQLAILRSGVNAALAASEALKAICRKHEMTQRSVWADLFAGWARGRLHDLTAVKPKFVRRSGPSRITA